MIEKIDQLQAEELISAQIEAYKELIWRTKEQIKLRREIRESHNKQRELRGDIFKYMDELRSIIMPRLEPYIKAMLGASGITEFQAKTMIYYGLGCYHIDSFDEYALLTLFGKTKTGKTKAMEQLAKVLPQWVLVESGATYSDLAKALHEIRVVVIEEEDKLRPQDRCEGLLQDRTQKAKRKAIAHIPPSQTVMEIDNWGATILHKRDSFNDPATRNRSIIIQTEEKVGYWQVSDVDKAGFVEIANTIIPDSSFVFEEILLEEKVSSRTLDIWRPVIKVAESCGDVSYLESCKEMLKRELLKVVSDDEPLTVAAQALVAAYYIAKGANGKLDYTKNIPLHDVVKACEDKVLVKMSPQKMKANLRDGLGFEISFGDGNNWVKANPNLAEALEEKLSSM